MASEIPEPNPYAPPEASIAGPPLAGTPGLEEAEATRREYLNHEASVKSIGSLQILGGIVTLIGTAVNVSTGLSLPATALALNSLMIVLYLALGIGLIRLRPWARWTCAALLGVSLLTILALGAFIAFAAASSDNSGPIVAVFVGYGLGSLIVGYMLYLLLSAKAGVVFSREYRAVIDATPHIKYKNGCLVKGCLAALVVIIVVAILVAVIGSIRR